MVFCGNCRYHEWTASEYGSCHWCEHPKNILSKHNEMREWKEYPDTEDANKDNKCKLWERKLTLKEKIKLWLNRK